MVWEKEHWRTQRYRIKRIAVSPEEIGLTGCWQVLAVRREKISFDPRDPEATDEIHYYAASITVGEMNEAQLTEVVRGHWSGIENGVHYRRDVSFGEDACRVAQRSAAHALATLRNLAIGLYEIEKERERIEARGCKSWSRQMTVSHALKLLRS